MQTTAAGSVPARTWRFPRVPLRFHLTFLMIAWIVWMVICLVITLWIARFRDITGSAWEPFAGIAPWFLAFQSGHMMFFSVPLFVANGRTRNESFREWTVFAGVYSAFGALLVTIGYQLERVLYTIGGWPAEVGDGHLFSSHTDVARIFLEYLLTFGVWTAAGGLVGSAIYQWPKAGWLALIPVSVLVGISGEVTRSPVGPFGAIADRLAILDGPSVLASLVVAVICTVIGTISAWLVVRDMPLRNR